ncbi:hypothetical protein LTR74_018612 [Friedmanniomyces endolithicus]|nr:hypothetical protein LTR74_018612 [Friedmanniomyces endolithicus]
MSARRKITVTAVFGFRLGVAGLLIAYLEFYVGFLQHGRGSIDVVDYTILQQVLLGYSLSSATIPCLKGFLGRFQTGDLARLSEDEVTKYENGSNPASHGNSYALAALDGNGKSRSRVSRSHFVRLQHEVREQSAQAYVTHSGEDNRASVRSFGSDRMFIQRTVDIDIVRQ